MMIWVRIAIVCTFICLLEANMICTRHVKWDRLIKTLTSMGTGMSLDCAVAYKEDSLCEVQHLFSKMEHDVMFLIDIVKKTEALYMKNPDPENFIRALHHTHHTVSKCVHHSGYVENENVDTCFSKLEAFLQDSKFNSHCAWEIIHLKVREILQRLEIRSVRRR